MNKIKLMYDVAKAMKDKEVFIGTLEVAAKKDQTDCFALRNEFEKNLITGQVKVKLNTSLDCDGQQLKHESTSEFNLQNFCGAAHHRHHKHLRGHFHSHGCCETSDCCGEESDTSCCGVKGKFAALGYVLKLIDKLEINELDNNAVALSLNIDEIPVELMQHIHGRFQHHGSPEGSPGPQCCSGMKDIVSIEKPVIDLNVLLNADKAIEKLVITASGTARDKDDQIHEMSFKAELNLKW